jgi:hypothetical protein
MKVKTWIKSSKGFAVQDDETSDITGLPVLLAFVRCIYDNEVEEEKLMCKPLSGHATGENIFYLIQLFIAEEGLS